MKPNAVTITTHGDKIHVATPYNPTFNQQAKRLGGRWSSDGKVWVFHTQTESRVRETVIRLFGTDRIDYTSVTVRIDANKAWRQDPTGDDTSMYYAGRKILSRAQRDAAIRLGDGVASIAGTLPISGGSMRYPSLALCASDGVILEIYDVPAGHVDLEDDYVEIVEPNSETPEQIDVEALLAEKEKLAARLAEIDEILDSFLAPWEKGMIMLNTTTDALPDQQASE